MKIPVACGTVFFKTPLRDIRRLTKSVRTAAEVAGTPCNFFAIDNSNCVNAEDFVSITGNILGGEFLPHEGNLGFGGGHNRLMASAFGQGAEYYLALNPDGFLHPNALLSLLSCAVRHNDFALIEARQFPNEHPKNYDPETLVTPWCSGACLMITKHLYSKIGGFDDGFFMYCEDVDYSWRARLAGAPCIIAADAFFFHDIIDRLQSDFARWHMALSMKRLLSKWTMDSPRPLITASLAKMLHDVPMEVRRMGSAPGAQLEDPRRAEIAEFGYSFGFSPFRWS